MTDIGKNDSAVGSVDHGDYVKADHYSENQAGKLEKQAFEDAWRHEEQEYRHGQNYKKRFGQMNRGAALLT